MKNQITLSVFFPVYNEEENVRATIKEAARVLDASPYIANYEIIIVNDGSSDNSRYIAETLARAHTNVRVINHERNGGYGAALKTGIQAAHMDYVFFTDADLQFDINELHHLLIHLPEYPVVIGYRAPRRDPFMRLLNARGWNVLNRLLFGLHVRDIDCAFKVFRRTLVQPLRLRAHGAMSSAEMLIRLTRRHVPIKEVPVSHFPRSAGSPTGARLSVIIRAFREMMQLWWGDLGPVTQKQALRFIAIGIINTLVDASFYIIFTREVSFFALHPVNAKFFSFLAGTVSSLYLNRTWTFRIRHRITFAEIVRFYAAVGAALAVNVSVMNILLTLRVYDLVALGSTTILTFAVSFTLSKFWVFTSPSGERSSEYAAT